MTVRVSRTFDVPISQRAAWELLSDPAKRAEAISIVERYESRGGEQNEMTWHVRLPIPAVDRTFSITTRDLERDPPRFVKFEGRSRMLDVVGEHELTATDDGTRVENRFVVQSKIPGVERFFKRNLDDELENIKRALHDHIDDGPDE